MLLASQTITAGAIADEFDAARSTISKHIQILTECGLVESNQQGREIYYQIKLDKVNEVDFWLHQLRDIAESRVDNLEKYLVKLQSQKHLTMISTESKETAVTPEDVFVISHTFKADAKTLYDMWTAPEVYASWMGPAGAEMSFISTDVREGGASQWVMTTPDGVTKYGKLHFKVMNAGRLLAYTQHFCDEAGNFIKAPFHPTYPDTLLTTVNFVPISATEVRMTVKWEVYGDATEAEIKTFDEMEPIMQKGWGESFEKIESLLSSAKN